MRLPIANTLRNRGATTAKDARLLNCFVEEKGGIRRVVKRPSLVATFAALEGGAGDGLGLFAFTTPSGTSTLIGIQNDVLNNSPTPVVTRLAFTTQPVDWKIATAMSPSVVVTARDSFGNTMTGYTGTVTIAFSANPNSGTLSGTLSVAAVAGVATFSNLKIDKVGGGYKLQATASLLSSATSSVFKIISTLAFTVQPSSTAAGSTISTVEVSVVDAASAVIAGYTGNITVAIGTNPSSGILSGTKTVAAVSGVASFASLAIDAAGAGYTLSATENSGGLVAKISDAFNIGIYSLTAASDSSLPGFLRIGFLVSQFGSISPTSFNGMPFFSLMTSSQSPTPVNYTTILEVLGSLSQSTFTSITANGKTLLSASATYSFDGALTHWTWIGTSVGGNENMLTSAGAVSVSIT